VPDDSSLNRCYDCKQNFRRESMWWRNRLRSGKDIRCDMNTILGRD